MCAAIGNAQATFLNACTQAELDSMFNTLISHRLHRWHRMEAQRGAIEALRGIMMHDATGNIVQVTGTGQWWMDWSNCLVFFPGAVPAPVVPPDIHHVLTFKSCPAGVRDSIFNAWKGRKTNVKVGAHLLAWKSANLATQMPHNLGAGASISHLCDTHSCCRRDHLMLAVAHQANMDRQRCRGVILVSVDGDIVHQEQCPHDTSNDFSESCRRIHVITLDNVNGDPNKIMATVNPAPARAAILP